MIRSFSHLAVRGAGLLLAVALAAPVAAQDQGEVPSWHVPGWSFTPSIAFGVQRDTNVSLAGPDVTGQTAGDTLFQFEPSGQLEFYSPRTTFGTGYTGSVRRYFDLGGLDSLDHRAFMNLRYRASRRVTLAVIDTFTQQPTTDALQLNGLPFARVGSRFNAVTAGIEARLTKSIDLGVHYEMSWVDFRSRADEIELTGGVVHGIRSQMKKRVTERVAVGGEYEIRWANLNSGEGEFTYHDAGGAVDYRAGENTTIQLAGGFSHLQDRGRDLTRTSPYARAGITHRVPRASFGAEYRRSYAPSFFLGGSHQGQDLLGFVDMPFNRNRIYVNATAAWRRTDPVIANTSPLDTLWLRSALGYTVQRWLRVEGYHIYSNQDNRVAGGRITRQLLGAQLVLSEPVRIR